MPGGLLSLVAYGAQNILISGNPKMSFFQSVFRQYTHFSSETIAVPLSTTTLLQFDKNATFRTVIPRSGDLITGLYLRLRLPPIYSKVYVPDGGDPALDGVPYEFCWVPHLGAHMIENVSIYIGGQEISSFDGEWLFARRRLDIATDARGAKLDRMWGHVPELYDPANGIYAWVDTSGGTGYPSVRPTTDTVQNNRFSIPEALLQIPLSFWFNEDNSLALPLIALQQHQVEIAITIRPLRELYTVVDVTSTDTPRPRIRPLDQTDMHPAAFFLDVGMGNAPTDSWDLQPQLEATYIFLADAERRFFAAKPHDYLVRRIRRREFANISTASQLSLDDQAGLVTRLVWFARRPDAVAERNDWENFTNWVNSEIAPRLDGSGIVVTLPNSGVNLLTSQRAIIRSAHVICDGMDILAIKPLEFYTDLQPYERSAGTGHPGLLELSFELSYSPTQPAGSVNFSRLRKIQLAIDVYPPIQGLTHTVIVYVETLNFLHLESGMGGLMFAL